MNVITLQKKADILEVLIKKSKRALLEFEVAQAKWEIAQGKVRTFKSSKELRGYVESKLR